MTRDDIIRLAQEVWSADDAYSAESLHRFAALVAAAEREACAKVADAWDADHPETNYGRCIAAAIRARG
jgi:hypothetical protein